VLQIAPSGYRRHVAQQRNPALRCCRAQRDDALTLEIQRVWDANMQCYGAVKVWKQLRREGIEVARCTVERLMRRAGLQGIRRGQIVQTTVAGDKALCPLDRVQRQFHADRPNQLWVSDFTYVSTWQGWLYVAFVIDVFARRIVGWRVSTSMKTDFGPRASLVCPSAALLGWSDPSQRPWKPVRLDPLYRTAGRGRH